MWKGTYQSSSISSSDDELSIELFAWGWDTTWGPGKLTGSIDLSPCITYRRGKIDAKIINKVIAIPDALNSIAPLGIGTSSTPKKKKKEIAKMKPIELNILEKVIVSNVSKYVVMADHDNNVIKITIVDSINWYEPIKTKYSW